ncbi:MAG: gamma-glutamyltransferase family protein [Tagaea sp.]|nr:gamma-glutamyltransferase family protein [Tagaea sp.]
MLLPCAFAASLVLTGCGWLGGGASEATGVVGSVRGFLGGASVAEPRAALVARDILSAGGSAADAAVAAALTLTVTLPSQAPLGGGGFCLVAVGSGRTRTVESIAFPAIAGGLDAQIATPGISRGMFALHARYGRLRWEQLVTPAESLARNGTDATRALALDVAAHAERLAADPILSATFLPGGRPIAEGDRLVQPQTAAALGVLRSRGPGDLHQGQFARALAQSFAAAGMALPLEALAQGAAQQLPAIRVGESIDLFVGTTPAAGALAAGQIFAALESRWRTTAPDERPALLLSTAAAASRARAEWLRPDLSSSVPLGEAMASARLRALAGAGGEWAAEPDAAAGTTFVVIDREGGAVACALTGHEPWGIARLPQGSAFLMAPAPRAGGADSRWLTVAIALKDRADVIFAGGASGGAASPMALAQVALDTLQGREALARAIDAPRMRVRPDGSIGVDGVGLIARLMPRGYRASEDAGGVGRVQAAHCPDGLSAAGATCRIETDRRGAGLAIGSN